MGCDLLNEKRTEHAGPADGSDWQQTGVEVFPFFAFAFSCGCTYLESVLRYSSLGVPTLAVFLVETGFHYVPLASLELTEI